MKRISTPMKWTRGRSRVERPTKGAKINLASKQKIFHFPLRFLNSLSSGKRR